MKNLFLSDFSTYRIGGVAKVAIPKSIFELKKIIKYAKKNKLKTYIFGVGSNTLFPDDPSPDYIFISLKNLIKINNKRGKLFLSAGVPSALLAVIGLLTDSEELFFTHLLPGSIGGGIFMNARCYNNEFCNILDKIYYLDENNKVNFIEQKNCSFAYKSSIFQHHKWIILGATFNLKNRLKLADKVKLLLFLKSQDISDLMNFYNHFCIKNIKNFFNIKKIPEILYLIEKDRASKHHFDYPSCGSVFKNNYDFGVPTGKIVDELGLKGLTKGGAKVSDFHGNFIINFDKATQNDIIYLIERIQEGIKNKYGFVPEPEVRIIK
ncbi:MAG: UDP-N-acetylmuramate dehydrogenase [Brevinematales bacterium]|nr:UDP-N-acetylmuramate dehydrogenase [Brevinematales bacterium]